VRAISDPRNTVQSGASEVSKYWHQPEALAGSPLALRLCKESKPRQVGRSSDPVLYVIRSTHTEWMNNLSLVPITLVEMRDPLYEPEFDQLGHSSEIDITWSSPTGSLFLGQVPSMARRWPFPYHGFAVEPKSPNSILALLSGPESLIFLMRHLLADAAIVPQILYAIKVNQKAEQHYILPLAY